MLAPRETPMSYPPAWRHVTDPADALRLMAAHPFAHLFTSSSILYATRIPFVTDSSDGRPSRLRAHLNKQNPQAQGIDGAQVLVAFSGPATYVSPNWRIDKTRGGTYDFEEVIVRGKASVVEGEEFFRALIDDLSALIEPQYAEVADHPVWQTSIAEPGYIERLVPHITQFEIDVEACEVISKLHQQFPEEDRRSIAEHLDRCNRDDAQAIAKRIRETL